MSRALLIIISLCLISITEAEETVDFRGFKKPEISELLHQASKHDGELGLSVGELLNNFGKPDNIANNSNWENGALYEYQLSDKRYLKMDILNGVVVHAVIITQDQDVLLVWK